MRRGRVSIVKGLVWAYHRGWGALRRVRPGAEAWLGAAVMGALSRDGVVAVNGAIYDRWSQYVGDAHNDSGLFPWEAEALERYFAGRRSVVLVGAGGGREVLELWRHGFRVDAYECNPAFVRAAARILPARGCPFAVRHLAADRAPTEGGPYDAAILGWGVYTHVVGREARLGLLRGVRARMAAGAPLLLSFFTRPEEHPAVRRVERIASALRRRRGQPPVELGDMMMPAFAHFFTRAELEAEVVEAGFQLVRFQAMGAARHESGWAVARALDASGLHQLASPA